MKANRFFSPVVRIQSERGHHLVDSGPYRLVRHPGYAGSLLSCVGGALALGSCWALVPVGALGVLILRRIVVEDRFLKANLEGYAEYSERVRYRLLPGVW
jgi:protein-S-isoprenylcysteine O-methyltransferase Ste14